MVSASRPKRNILPYLLIGGAVLVMLPCVGCFVVVIVLRVAGASDTGAAAAGRAEIRAYNDRLVALFPYVPDVAGPAQPCAAEVLRAGYQGNDGSGRMYIPSLRYETLARWSVDAAEDSDDAYAWLDSIDRVDPDAVSNFEIGNVRWRVGQEARARYLAVFRTGIARPPAVRNGGFEAGLFVGRLYIMDTVSGQMLCHAPIAAQSGESVAVGGLLHTDDADEAVRADMREQLKSAATTALRSISIDLYLSTTPTIGDPNG